MELKKKNVSIEMLQMFSRFAEHLRDLKGIFQDFLPVYLVKY